MDAEGFISRLRGQIAGALRSDPASRELYACDASLYRRVPIAALRARDETDIDAAVSCCREFGVPVTMRGAGTSLAGQAVGTGLVVDCGSLDGLEIDPDARRAQVGPGVVLDALNRAAAAHGLMFGPDVASGSRATLGGMIANNSAGARSVVHGLTADHVMALDVTLADGTRCTVRRGIPPPAALAAAVPLARDFTPPDLVRRVSGYALDALGGPDPDWPRVLCGSEGTLALTRRAEVGLIPLPAARGLALLPFGSVDDALATVSDLLETGPSAVELLDRSLVDPANRPPAVRELLGVAVAAEALLMVEYSGDPAEVDARLGALDGARPLRRPEEQAAAWAVRRSGIARALRGPVADTAGDPRPLPFIEDPAVPPARLAGFARDVRALLADEGVNAVWYGHASVGCLHIRPLMDLRLPGTAAQLRRIAEGVADLVAACGGSLSGEHGDGRLRGELLPRMYPPHTIAAFGTLKRIMDPQGILNPGVLAHPEPLDRGLRLLQSPPRRPARTAVDFSREGGLARAGEACNGNGACRAHAGAMCPSFQALGDERHSTRGRAVLLRAALEGRLVGGLADDGLHEALELCLGCKACAAECPAQVDMARLKVEALAHRHRTVRPAPMVRLMAHTHGLLAAASRAPRAARLLARLLPVPAGAAPLPVPSRRWRPPAPAGDGPRVVLMADTFTRFLEPEVGDAAVRVLTAAGARVEVVDPGCCGRPLLSQGFVDAARRRARGALDRLAPHAMAGVPVVILEPSCWSMMVDDLGNLLPHDPRAAWVADAATTLEGACEKLGGARFHGGTARVMSHDHCHSRALGAGPLDAALARLTGASVAASGAGCCGMAGAFGHLHPDLSRRIGEDRLAPAARGADVLVAAGTSCRAQMRHLTGRTALHPAEYLARQLTEDPA